MSSREKLGTTITHGHGDVMRVSAGTPKHEETSWYAFQDIFEWFLTQDDTDKNKEDGKKDDKKKNNGKGENKGKGSEKKGQSDGKNKGDGKKDDKKKTDKKVENKGKSSQKKGQDDGKAEEEVDS